MKVCGCGSEQIADIEHITSLTVARLDNTSKTDVIMAETIQDETDDKAQAPRVDKEAQEKNTIQQITLDKGIAQAEAKLERVKRHRKSVEQKDEFRKEKQSAMESALQDQVDEYLKVAAEKAQEKVMKAEESLREQRTAELKLRQAIGRLRLQVVQGKQAAKQHTNKSVQARLNGNATHDKEAALGKLLNSRRLEATELQEKATALDARYKQQSEAVLSGIATVKVEEALTKLSHQQKLAHKKVDKAVEAELAMSSRLKAVQAQTLIRQCKGDEEDGLIKINLLWVNTINISVASFEEGVDSINHGASDESNQEKKAAQLTKKIDQVLVQAQAKNAHAEDQLKKAIEQATRMGSKETMKQKHQQVQDIKEEMNQLETESKLVAADAENYANKVMDDATIIAQRKLRDVRDFTKSLNATHNNSTHIEY